MREQTIAQRTPPPSEPAKRWFLRPSAIGLIARSAGLFELDAAIIDKAAERAFQPRGCSGLLQQERCGLVCAQARSPGRASMPQQALGQHGKPFDSLSLIHLPRQQAEVPNSALSPQNWIVFG